MLLLAAAHAADVWTGANLRGAGGVGIAHPGDNAAITQNPANLGLSARYDAMGMFTVGPLSEGAIARQALGLVDVPALPDLEWGLSLADSQTNKKVAFGLAYSGGLVNPPLLPAEVPGFTITGEVAPNYRRTHDFAVALAAPLFDRKLSFGAAAGLYFYNGDRIGNGVTFDLDVGVSGQPVKWLTLGLTGQNLIPLEGFASPDGYIGAGVLGGLTDVAFVEADVQYRWEDAGLSPWSVNAGTEVAVGLGRVRAGYRFNGDLAQHGVTWGLGVKGKAGGLEYGMQIPIVEGLAFGDLVHVISLRIDTNGFRFDTEPEGEDPAEMWQR